MISGADTGPPINYQDTSIISDNQTEPHSNVLYGSQSHNVNDSLDE